MLLVMQHLCKLHANVVITTRRPSCYTFWRLVFVRQGQNKVKLHMRETLHQHKVFNWKDAYKSNIYETHFPTRTPAISKFFFANMQLRVLRLNIIGRKNYQLINSEVCNTIQSTNTILFRLIEGVIENQFKYWFTFWSHWFYFSMFFKHFQI